MRKAVLFALAAMTAPPLAAGWWPAWNTNFVRLEVGWRTTVHEKAMWSGLVDYSNGVYNWSFRSDNDSVAVAAIHIHDLAPHDVEIVAVGPGHAAIRLEEQRGLGWPYVQIEVVCAEEPAVRAAARVIHARPGESVTLKAVSDIADRTRFTWYLGREGDTSRPLAATGPEIVLVSRAVTQYVWVNAVTPCSASSAEFRIDVPARTRAAH